MEGAVGEPTGISRCFRCRNGVLANHRSASHQSALAVRSSGPGSVVLLDLDVVRFDPEFG